MRSLRALSLGLILIGGLILAAPNGAFDLMSADRGVNVETASDENALVGIEKEPISLVEENGNIQCDLQEGCVYEYTDVELVRITDQTPSSELEITDGEVNISTETTDYPSHQEDEITRVNDEYIVEGTLWCDATWFFGFYQERSSTDLSMDLETSDGTITVELEREIPVQCE
ncbi:hypothetical protein NP511_11825 [Natrinema thermotolerans]|uniref:Uncharacterized protein n=1 Tax=Natrinema thermotolerans TaxID=121872 RepID=A0AAF0P7T0_9EURY|nr:hypothetical protein [Natrinema thermotolerans]QCC59118.1 hypothetical protein DVR14_10960 [Natrinema thermotolerans]WMT06072.1 hypothetical protein NP511_11825 [Natrinema thermotolerans]